MEDHQIASIFPLLAEDELSPLASDIKARGLLDPIWLYEDKILDGRNRFRACQLAGVAPRYETFEGTPREAIDFVWSKNRRRRQLNSSQAAIAEEKRARMDAEYAAVVEEMRAKAPKGGRPTTEKPTQPVEEVSERNSRTIDAQRAASAGTNRTYLSDARKILDTRPDLAEKIERGEATIKEARKELRREANREKEQQALASLPEGNTWTVTDDQSVVQCQAVLTDPPYGILDEPWEPAELEQFTTEWATRWNECGADFFAIFWSQRYLWDGRQWFDESLCGYKFQQLLVWNYRNNKSPQSRSMFKQTWEPVYLYRKIGSGKEVKVRGSNWGDDMNDFDCQSFAVPQSNFNGANEKQHPAQKPVEVMRWLTCCLTDPGDLIVDPFTGSGTTGIAASTLSRKFHGIEQDAEFLKLAKRRIALYGVQ